VQERRSEMKKKTEVKRLRINKETLLPLGSPQMNEVVGGYPISPVGHLTNTHFIHA
jgi:hypothetical protein